MKKEIKDYLHLYLECEVVNTANKHMGKLVSAGYTQCVINPLEGFDPRTVLTNVLKPILRPLSDIKKDESEFIADAAIEGKPTIYVNSEITQYLLAKQFDLFGLIESGLAINKTEAASVNSDIIPPRDPASGLSPVK